jgi:hypothetical protein
MARPPSFGRLSGIVLGDPTDTFPCSGSVKIWNVNYRPSSLPMRSGTLWELAMTLIYSPKWFVFLNFLNSICLESGKIDTKNFYHVPMVGTRWARWDRAQ